MIDPSKIEWFSVDEILNHWQSCDSSTINIPKTRVLGKKAWLTLLDRKREGWRYEPAKKTLEESGFLMPLAYMIGTRGRKRHLNGHHRLASAIDLGYKFIPYYRVEKSDDMWFDIKEFDGTRLVPTLEQLGIPPITK